MSLWCGDKDFNLLSWDDEVPLVALSSIPH